MRFYWRIYDKRAKSSKSCRNWLDNCPFKGAKKRLAEMQAFCVFSHCSILWLMDQVDIGAYITGDRERPDWMELTASPAESW